MNRMCENCKHSDKLLCDEPCKTCFPARIAKKLHICWEPKEPISNRPTEDEYYLDIAKAVSRRSTCLRRQYGAVIVNNNEIISTGYNGPPRGEPHCTTCKRIGHEHNDGDYLTCESVHAEMNAIISASRSEMLGATLYLAGFENGISIEVEPCPVCARMIKNAGIKDVRKSR